MLQYLHNFTLMSSRVKNYLFTSNYYLFNMWLYLHPATQWVVFKQLVIHAVVSICQAALEVYMELI